MCVCISSCTDDVIVEVENSQSLPPFKLYVNQEASSRLALGEDGLSVVWEPGDQLVMVKKDKSGEPIYLDCDLEEMAYSATFTAGEGVPVGEYYVFYNYDRCIMEHFGDYACTHQGLMPTEVINDEDRLALWGEISVKEGDSSASIILKHIYAKVKISIKSLYTSEWKGFSIGMYASKGGFPSYLMFTENGVTNAVNDMGRCYSNESQKSHNILLSEYFYPKSDEGTFDNEKNYTALILPADLSEGSLYVYGICEDNSYGNNLICFETEKKNVKFEAGKSYKISLHLGYPTDSASTHKAIPMYTIEDEESWDPYYKLSTPDECRVAAYIGGGKYQITNDIDFQGQTYLPISAGKIVGNGHTIKNITLDWSDTDNVGLIRNHVSDCGQLNIRMPECQISDLTLENVSFSGHSFVGAFGGVGISTDNCKVTGNSTITGTGDFVGGIVGHTYAQSIINTNIDATCTVKGRSCVGGISGSYAGNYSTMKSLTSSATVTATGDFVGGIAGLLGHVAEEEYYTYNTFSDAGYGGETSYLKLSNNGNVTGRNHVGGIFGTASSFNTIKQLINEGNIKGESYVGGIVGTINYVDQIRIAYSTGEITATTYAGGIVGSMAHSWYSNRSITDCYSLANISVSNGGYAGGIVGISGFNSSEDDYEYEETRKHSIANCYFAGTNSTGKGIVGYDLGNTFIKNCLTTLSSLGIESNVTNSFTGVTSILNQKSVINGNNAYSNETWPINQYPAYCPKFIDFSGDVDSPDFGDSDIEI